MGNVRVRLIVIALFFSANLTININHLQAQPVSKSIHVERQEEIAVSAVEDLMREHGVLSRILLIYEELIRRLDNNETFPSETLAKSTETVRNFIQNYHEKLEEKYLFSRFRKANKLVELAMVLEQQHEAGRKLIGDIMIQEGLQNPDDKKKLVESLRLFIRLYRPHKAREDTILFPVFHNFVAAQEHNALGEEFEGEEQKLFGEEGFQK